MGLYDRNYMREEGGWRGHARGIPRAGWLALTCAAVFVFQLFVSPPDDIAVPGAVTLPQLLNWELWRLLTYPFVHGHAFHLILNMLWLWLIGRIVEEDVGPRHFFGLFAAGAVLGALVDLPVYPDVPLVGASAGVWALTACLATRHPALPVGFPFLPGVTLKLKNLVLGLLIFEIISAAAQFLTRHGGDGTMMPRSQIASLAHLGGALAGFLYAKALSGSFSEMVRQSEEKQRWWQQERARRRERTRVTAGRAPVLRPQSETPPPADLIEEVVNPILEKMHEHGIESLSPEERKILADAAQQLKRRR